MVARSNCQIYSLACLEHNLEGKQIYQARCERALKDSVVIRFS